MTPAMQLALGRIFRMLSRPFEPGDIEQYERCQAIIMAEAEAEGCVVHRYLNPGKSPTRARGARGEST